MDAFFFLVHEELDALFSFLVHKKLDGLSPLVHIELDACQVYP